MYAFVWLICTVSALGSPESERGRINVHYYYYPFFREKVLELESSVKVRGDDEGWLKLNVTQAANLWTLFPASNMGMFMRVTNRKGV